MVLCSFFKVVFHFFNIPIYSPVNKCFGFLQILATELKLLQTSVYQYLFGDTFPFLLDIYEELLCYRIDE